MKELITKYGLHITWAMSAVAMIGSLYFSQILLLPPCVLCWYQRIAMYPLVWILAVGIFRKDRMVWLYALPLAVIGWIIGIYHNLLYYKIIPESLAPCIQGVSCTTKQLEWFGFLTIPLMSLIAFTIIVIILSVYAWMERHEQRS
jgi:disulfide bond formation protein DsbB